jgi:hypothetical protein
MRIANLYHLQLAPFQFEPPLREGGKRTLTSTHQLGYPRPSTDGCDTALTHIIDDEEVEMITRTKYLCDSLQAV